MLVFYFLAAIQLFFSYKSLKVGFEYLQYFKDELAKPSDNFQPFASVIVPCRGIDQDLEENLQALFEQEYFDYEVVFVVDRYDDLSVATVEELVSKYSNSKLIVAGEAGNCGQKVHNLRIAVLKISDNSDVIVFVDSDVRPGKNWLANLVAPLEDKGIGCTTGYRWFLQKRGGFATHLRSVWNASIASALGRNPEGNFCWGGSTAITRELFEKLGVQKKWDGTLSDDFALTAIMNDAGLPIRFVPQCLTASVEDSNLSETLEFTTRQMKITRVYSPGLWKVSVIGSVLFTITFWGAAGLLFFLTGIHFWIMVLFLIVVFSLGAGKAWLRLNAVKLVLKSYHAQLKKQFLPQILFWTVSPILFIYNNFRAMTSSRIVWRGIEYELKSEKETAFISRNAK